MPLPSVLDEIDRLFDRLVHRRWVGRELVPAEIHEVEDGWMIRLRVQGMRTGDVSIGVHGRQLTISGKRHEERQGRTGESGWAHTRQEVSFERTMTLPAEADPNSIDARIENEILCIHVRRRQA